jgi:hypothetical protein
MPGQSRVMFTYFYKGFEIREVQLSKPTAGPADGAPSGSPALTVYRIYPLNAKLGQFITAPSRHDAEQQVDSGQAKRKLQLP